MSQTQDPIETFIDRTVSAEENAAAQAAEAEAAQFAQMLNQLHLNLKAALAADDHRKAIRLAYQILQHEPENDKIEGLYRFLLNRVGVAEREPVLSISTHPLVLALSILCLLVATCTLAVCVLAPDDASRPMHTDVVSCLVAFLFFGIPVFDILIASGLNRINHHRLKK